MRALPLAPALVALLVLAAPGPASARDLLILEAGGVRDSGNDLIRLIEDFVDQEGAFTGLALLPSYGMSLDYLGIDGAITATATNPTLLNPVFTLDVMFPLTGFSKTFTGASDAEVEDQLEDFLQSSQGGRELAKLIEQTNRRTPLATLDGNPRATTALLARGAFDRFGLGLHRTRAGAGGERIAEWGHFDLVVDGGGGMVDVDEFDSLYVADAALTLGGDFEPGVGVYATLLGQYRNYDGAEIYDAGVELALPLALLRPSAGSPVGWTLTPFGQVGAGATLDLGSGGLFAGGGGVSALSLHAGPLELAIANELVYYRGVPLGEVGDYELDTRLDQLITRNGAKLALHPAALPWLSAELGVSFTSFLQTDAAVDFYTTPFAGITLHTPDDLVHLRLGYEADLGAGYQAHLGRAEVGVTF